MHAPTQDGPNLLALLKKRRWSGYDNHYQQRTGT